MPELKDEAARLIYFHGAPGGPRECDGLVAQAAQAGVRLVAIERFDLPSAMQGEAYFQALAREVERLAEGRPVNLLGFSLGAFVALQTARHLPTPVRSLHLVAAPAPLEAGDFLGQMAGGGVFRLARDWPRLFSLLSRGQGCLARYWPAGLYRLLFASAQAADRPLAATAAFREQLLGPLQDCFGPGLAGYLRDLRAYVQPWQASLAQIEADTWLWHGDADNWSPPAMALYLQTALRQARPCHWLPGLSHYSSLQAALPQIVRQLADDRAAVA